MVKRHANHLYQFAMKQIADSELCKDVDQETVLSAIINLSGFKGKSAERTWITSILKNKIIDHYHKNTKEISTNELQITEENITTFFEDKGLLEKEK